MYHEARIDLILTPRVVVVVSGAGCDGVGVVVVVVVVVAVGVREGRGSQECGGFATEHVVGGETVD